MLTKPPVFSLHYVSEGHSVEVTFHSDSTVRGAGYCTVLYYTVLYCTGDGGGVQGQLEHGDRGLLPHPPHRQRAHRAAAAAHGHWLQVGRVVLYRIKYAVS